MSETALMRQIRAAVSNTGRATLWRNNVGLDAERGVAYGLGKGSADLVGFVHATGRFFALEVKTPVGRIRPEQKVWVNHVTAHGGYAAFVRSVDDALKALEDASR